MITLSELAIYPIKSCAQLSLSSAMLSDFGLDLDRRWMLIDDRGYMMTQRKYAAMCLINCAPDDKQLNITAPGMEPLIITQPEPGNRVTATVWDDQCSGIYCGDEAAKWFSDFLKTPARLVFFPQTEFRQCDLKYSQKGDQTAFSDGFPYLLISQASLDDLNTRLATQVAMKRFRPNLVVSGNQAFDEDNWKRIRIGDIDFRLVKPCSRCVIPSIDPETAQKTAEPVKTLASYRIRENKIFFGQNVIAEGKGRLEIGMEVEILE